MDYFDLHADTPFECHKTGQGFYVNRLAISVSQAELFESWSQTFAFWIRDDCTDPYGLYSKMRSDFLLKLKPVPKNFTPVFAVEGGAVLEDRVDRISILKTDGIKLLTLVWNGENRIGGGIKSEKPLTEFGKRVIEKMNEAKMGCDLSHMNRKGFFAAAERAEFPLCSHSNCFSVSPHPRNLSDEQIRLVAQKGGVIGLCFYPEFLKGEPFEAIYSNIAHLLYMGMEDHIAIGSDFDGAVMDERLSSPRHIPALRDFLARKGMENNLLHKIFYLNAHNFIAKLG